MCYSEEKRLNFRECVAHFPYPEIVATLFKDQLPEEGQRIIVWDLLGEGMEWIAEGVELTSHGYVVHINAGLVPLEFISLGQHSDRLGTVTISQLMYAISDKLAARTLTTLTLKTDINAEYGRWDVK